MDLADSHMDWRLATLSVVVVRIVLLVLEYNKIHEKVYKFIVCEFGCF